MDHTIAFLNATYTKEYCESLEMAYGKDLMSEGGGKEIDAMVSGVDVRNKKVLDFGSGLGGMAFHLALNYNAYVTGIEINPETIAIAQKNTPPQVKDRVSFILSTDGKTLPLADEAFDVIVSKGVIIHLSSKQREIAFQELYRVLKKGGALLIHDGLSPEQDKWSTEVEDLMQTESLPLYAYSFQTYQAHLSACGFKKIRHEDRSQISSQYHNDIINRLQSEPMRSHFIEKYGEKTLLEHIKGYHNIIKAHQSGDLINMRIVTYKE